MKPRYGSSQHEHLYGYVQAESLYVAFQKATGSPLDEVAFGTLADKDGEARAEQAIAALFGPEALTRLPKPLAHLSLRRIAEELAHFWGEPAESLLLQFFRFGGRSAGGIPGYKFQEDLRKHLFKSLFRMNRDQYLRFLELAFRDTLERADVSSELVAFSVPGELFEREGCLLLRRVLAEYGIRTELYYSYPRYKLTEDRAVFRSKLAVMTSALAEGWGQGLDITGSLDEGGALPTIDPKRFRERLAEIRDAIGMGPEAVWKFHVFEGARTGPFYDAFWECLEGGALRASVVIGHIIRLEAQDMVRFQSLAKKGMRLSFDANYPSSRQVHRVPLDRWLGLLTMLLDKGFDVGFGGDGQGILQDESLEDLKMRLPPTLWNRLAEGTRRARSGPF